jgi:hypothetical protein
MGGAAEFLRDHPQNQPQGGSPASSLPATTSNVPTAASTPVLYLVGSETQANAIQQNLESLVTPERSLDATVRHVASAAEAAATMQAIADLNSVRRTLGLPAIQVVDLRTTPIGADPAAGGQASSLPPTSRTVATQTPHLYLVGSHEQAQAVDEGRFPVDDTVLVVGRETSQDEVTWLLTTMNEARRLQGQQPVQLVDLRPAAPAPAPTTMRSDVGGTTGAPVSRVAAPAAQPSASSGDSVTGDGRPMGGYAEWLSIQGRQTQTTAASPQLTPPSCPVPGVGLVNC